MYRKILLALLAGTTALWPAEALAMPTTISLISTFAAAYIGGGVVASTIAFYAVSAALYAGIAVGSSLLQSALTPKPQQPKPEDVQVNFRQATPVRTGLYGEGLLGGPWVAAATDGAGFFHRIIALSSRTLTAIDEIWVDDIQDVELTGDIHSPGTYVNSLPYSQGNMLYIEARLGAPAETYYSSFESVIPEWTPDHRGDGVASIYTIFAPAKPRDVQTFWPNGINTLIRAKCRGVAAYDPTDDAQDADDPDTWTYTDNAARVILDYMRHADGFRIPSSMLLTPQALEGWRQAVNDCNDAIPLKAGGAEPRYRIWGVYRFDERPADVLSRFLAACNGRLKPTADGGFHLEVGKWRDPVVTLDESHIVAFDGLARGRDIMQTANTVISQFTSVERQFQATDAQPWDDEDDVAERGEIPAQIDFLCAPSHGQCRRLMKIESYRTNPADVGTFILNKAGLICFGERFINMSLPQYEVAGTFEVTDFQFLFGEHGILRGCSITVQSIEAEAYAWDAATEEGEPGGVDLPPVSDPFEAPSGFDVTMQAGGNALVEWTPPTSTVWETALIQYENLTDATDPVDVQTVPADGSYTVGGLISGKEYRFRMRFEANVSGTTWTSYITDTALA